MGIRKKQVGEKQGTVAGATFRPTNLELARGPAPEGRGKRKERGRDEEGTRKRKTEGDDTADQEQVQEKEEKDDVNKKKDEDNACVRERGQKKIQGQMGCEFVKYLQNEKTHPKQNSNSKQQPNHTDSPTPTDRQHAHVVRVPSTARDVASPTIRVASTVW